MKISEKGLNLIKSFEGCRLTAYKCPAGVWTIGWGHTGDVTEGKTITQEQADQMLRDDMVAYELKVEKYNGIYGWNQNEFDALTSFAYNVGSIDQLTARGTRSREVIAEKMLAYNKGGGKVLPGLTRRRKAEQELFLAPVDSIAPAQPAGWVKDERGWWYRREDGSWPAGEWAYLEWEGKKNWYYFDQDGYMKSSCVLIIGSEAFALGQDGAMMEGKITLTTNERGALVIP